LLSHQVPTGDLATVLRHVLEAALPRSPTRCSARSPTWRPNNGTQTTAWGSAGNAAGQFSNPYGVAVDASGNVYVADTFNHRIQKFTGDGTFLAQWGAFGAGAGQFNQPWTLATDAIGNVYVVDNGNHRVEKFTSSGVVIPQWG